MNNKKMLSLPEMEPEAPEFTFFKKMYLKELNSYSRYDLPNAEERLKIYWQYILKDIYNISDEKELSKPVVLDNEMNKFVINMSENIKSSDSYFSMTENQKFNLLSCHGVSKEDIATVPKGVILCILTPLNRYSFQNINEIKELLNILSDLNERKKFLKNPCCYGKNSIGNLFEYATIYFENQKYFNLELSIGTKNYFEKKYDGIYDNNNLLNTYKRNDVDSVNASIIPNKDNFQSNLSLLLQENMGVVVIKCCRACDTYLENNIIQNIYRYEHFINVVNRSIKNNSDEDYNNCTKKTEKCKYTAQFKKVRNHYTNNSKRIERQRKAKLIITQKFSNLSILGNESIGLSYSQKRKIEEFKEREEREFFDNIRDEIKNMIDCFQENSSDLDIFKKYEELIIKFKKMTQNQQIIYSDYLKKNIEIEHFFSYVFYKYNIEKKYLYGNLIDFDCKKMTKIYLRNCKIKNLEININNIKACSIRNLFKNGKNSILYVFLMFFNISLSYIYFIII